MQTLDKESFSFFVHHSHLTIYIYWYMYIYACLVSSLNEFSGVIYICTDHGTFRILAFVTYISNVYFFVTNLHVYFSSSNWPSANIWPCDGRLAGPSGGSDDGR